MKPLKKYFLLLLTLALVGGCLDSTGWAQENRAEESPVAQGWSALDLILARPLGVAAGIAGTAIFVITLPFTIPSGGVKEAADMFIVKPFTFSFARKFPDEDI